MSCLIIKNDGIGDLILASGLISSVGEFFDGNVDLVTCTNNKEIAEGIEPIRDRYYCSRDSIRLFTLKKKKIFFPFWRTNKTQFIPYVPQEDILMMQALAENSYKIIACLRRFIRESTLVMMMQVHGEKKYCTWQFPMQASREMANYASQGWHHNEGLANILSELSYNKAFLEETLKTSLSSAPRLSFCHKQSVKQSTRKIALGIGGSSTNWPSGNWVELCIRLEVAGWKLILLGGNDAVSLGKLIFNKVPRIENKIGQLSWYKTAELMSDCDVYIGNDTSISHFASLILEKCLIILGGGTFRRFFPWPRAENQYVIYHGLNCFDCTWDCKFQDRFCLNLVRPYDVEKYFNEVIAGNARKECDLNANNESYNLACTSNKTYDSVFVRQI